MDQPNSKGRDKTKPHAAHRCPGFTSVAWPPPDASRLAALVSRSTAANLHKRTPKVKAGVTPPPSPLLNNAHPRTSVHTTHGLETWWHPAERPSSV